MSAYQIFDAFQDAVLVIDREGRVHYGNAGAAALLEVSERRLASGRPLAQFLALDPRLISDTQLDAISEMTQSREIAFTLPNGKSGWVQIVIQPQPPSFSSEPGARWIATLRDVTLEKTLHAKYKAELDQKEAVIVDLRAAREALQEYSEELEKMVEDRTQKLSEANALLKSILDSLGQGILVFERDGRCNEVHSKICRRLLGAEPTGKKVEQVLGLGPAESETFAKWRGVVFDELMPFEDLTPLAPVRLPTRDGLDIFLNYHPMRDEKGLAAVVLVATDRTLEIHARKEAEREHELAGRVTQVARHREAFRLYVAESRCILDELEKWNGSESSGEEIARMVHTLKGGAASFFLMPVAEACHAYEDLLSGETVDLVKLSAKARELREILERELALVVEMLGAVGETGEASIVEVPVQRLRAWHKNLSTAQESARTLEIAREIKREFSERPVLAVIGHLNQSLRTLAEALGKSLKDFVIEGGDTTVPLAMAQGLLGSLVHAFRNSIYHGIETREERRAAGKPEAGQVIARFRRDFEAGREWLSIEIEDDGRGVDCEKLRTKLLARGRADASELTHEELAQEILSGEISTAARVDAIAGRGVGLSAIASEVRELGGSAKVRSRSGLGMRLEVRVPISARGETGKVSNAA